MPRVEVSALYVLYTACSWLDEEGRIGAYPVSIRVVYADGGVAEYRITLVDWCAYGVNVDAFYECIRGGYVPVVVMPSRVAGFTYHIQSITMILWALRLPLDARRELTAMEVGDPGAPRMLWFFAATLRFPNQTYAVVTPGGELMLLQPPTLQAPERARLVVYLIPHSHWDINWLRPRREYRLESHHTLLRSTLSQHARASQLLPEQS